MKELFKEIKTHILNTSKYYEELGLVAPTTKDIHFGQVDLMKLKNALLVAILPEHQEEVDEGYIDGDITRTSWVVSFICRNDRLENLNNKICEYADAFRKSLNDFIINETVSSASIGKREYFFNAGMIEMQMSAVEIEFITTSY